MNLTSLNVILLNCEQEVMAALRSFSSYHHIWKEDRDDAMRKYDKLDIRMLLWLCRADVFFLFFAFPGLSKTALHCPSSRARSSSIETLKCKYVLNRNTLLSELWLCSQVIIYIVMLL